MLIKLIHHSVQVASLIALTRVAVSSSTELDRLVDEPVETAAEEVPKESMIDSDDSDFESAVEGLTEGDPNDPLNLAGLSDPSIWQVSVKQGASQTSPQRNLNLHLATGAQKRSLHPSTGAKPRR